jgi:hypothetical protein
MSPALFTLGNSENVKGFWILSKLRLASRTNEFGVTLVWSNIYLLFIFPDYHDYRFCRGSWSVYRR